VKRREQNRTQNKSRTEKKKMRTEKKKIRVDKMIRAQG